MNIPAAILKEEVMIPYDFHLKIHAVEQFRDRCVDPIHIKNTALKTFLHKLIVSESFFRRSIDPDTGAHKLECHYFRMTYDPITNSVVTIVPKRDFDKMTADEFWDLYDIYSIGSDIWDE